jgi:hypothetical protein
MVPRLNPTRPPIPPKPDPLTLTLALDFSTMLLVLL